MTEHVKMPALGESVTEGTVTRWLKQVGDDIAMDEPLLEVSTDKVDTEIPAPVAGVLEQILVAEDETVPVGADLAVIAASGSAPSAAAAVASPEPSSSISSSWSSQPSSQPEIAPVPAAAPAVSVAGAGTPVVMPALGESVTEGTVTRWLKATGDYISADEPLLEVSTDKVDTEIPAPASGVLGPILVAEDETVAVGAQLTSIAAAGAAAPSPSLAPPAPVAPPSAAPVLPQPAAYRVPSLPATLPTATPASAPVAPASTAAVAPASTAPTSTARFAAADPAIYVTPLVRKLAAEHGVSLTDISGTGVGGRVRKQDVLDAAAAREAAQAAKAAQTAAAAPVSTGAPSTPAAAAAAPSPIAFKRGSTEKMSRLRKVIAQRLVESLQTSAQLTSVVEVDVTKIAKLRDRAKADFKAREGVGLSFLPFFAQAAIEGLKVHPGINASVADDEITYHAQENLGIAVDTDKGLIVPVIKDAGNLNIAGIARKIADLADRTRSNRIGPDELGGGTFTLTNTGSRGALFDTPIVNLPQVAIMGTGAVVKRPVVVRDVDGGETIAIRSMVYLSLSYDHRVVDGADAARFLVTVKDRLEEGAFDADLGL